MDDLISIADLTRDDIERLFKRTDDLKADPGTVGSALDQQTLLMLFAKPSTRTRVSFETGMTQLGGHGIYFAMEQSQLSRGEAMKDTALVLSRYVDGIMARLFEHATMEELAEHATVPVINGLTDKLHPCQALTDLYTIQKHGLGEKVVYVGDGNNVAHSLMLACTTLGVNITVATPKGYEPDDDITKQAEERAEQAGSELMLMEDPQDAVEEADVIYTDVWVSMGDEAGGEAAASGSSDAERSVRNENAEEREAAFQPYQVNMDLVEHAGEAMVMHPLPAHRGKEITSDVMDSQHALVYDQAENRLHVQKALMAELMGEGS